MSLCAGTKVFVGRNNPIVLIPYADMRTSQLMDLSGVYEIQMCIGTATASSVSLGDAFSWSEDPEAPGRWVITLQPGLIPDLSVGASTLSVTVFDGDHQEGLVIVDAMEIEVVSVCG